jgi:hypothetical protein
MARVYISSTFQDLKQERASARDAILAKGHHPVGMEQYAASDERPLDRCLRDVRECDAYIGIIAWKYGFRPPGHKKSITHLEYEEARKHQKPTFLFLLEKGALWPRDRVVDEDQPDLIAFRTRLAGDKLVAFFTNSDTLSVEVNRSLDQLGPGLAIPEMLPYLCDRSDQEFDLRQTFQVADPNYPRSLDLRRPLIYFVHGDETEAHDKFLERTQRVLLPKLLPRQMIQSGIRAFHLKWPATADAIQNLDKRLELELSTSVLGFSGTREQVNGSLSGLLTPVLVHTHLITDHWRLYQRSCLDGFVRFWRSWDVGTGQILIILLLFKYRTKGRSWIDRMVCRRLNSHIRKVLLDYDFQALGLPHGKVLTELRGPTLAETSDWARSEEVAGFCDANGLVESVEAFFREWKGGGLSSFETRIPMNELAPKLKDLMYHNLLERKAL